MPKHTHKLKRIKYNNNEEMYFCVLDCTFKVVVKEALGKKTICWRCGDEFLMNEYSIRRAKPCCNKCIDHKETLSESEISFANIRTADVSKEGKINKPTSSLKERLGNLTSKTETSEGDDLL